MYSMRKSRPLEHNTPRRRAQRQRARSARSQKIHLLETHYSYTPSDARAARALCFDDARAERGPWVCGVHGGLGWRALPATERLATCR